MTTRREFLLAGVGTVAASVAACGGGDAGSTEPSPPASPPPGPTPPPPPPGPTPPPPPPGFEDPALIYDGPGGITGTHLYARLLPWKNPGGDWLDADGVAQGGRPFGETILRTGQSGEIVVDVTPLVVQGSEPSLVLRATAIGAMGPVFSFSTRESGQGPRLVVTYVDGATDSIPVMYDSECNLSTAYELGDRTAMTVGGSNAYLRFPAPTRSVASAKLVLNGGINTGGKLGVYKFALFRDPPPTDTFTLKGDPRVFFETACFARGTTPKYIDGKIWDLYVATLGGQSDPFHQRAIVSDDEGGQALQITFDPVAGNGVFNASVCFPNFDEADEAAWEFDIRLMPDMLTGLADGVKLFAGCSSSTKNDDAAYVSWAGAPNAVGRMGTLLAGNGGAKSHGNDGWSHRFDMWNTPAAPHPLHGRFLPMQYAYWPGQYDYYGDPWSWDLTHGSLQTGQWYTITQRCKVNSCVGTDWKPDAEFDGYINHALAVRRRNFYQRTTDTPLIALPPYNVRSRLAIGRIWLNTYHGGTALPLARCSFQVRNFRAARFA